MDEHVCKWGYGLGGYGDEYFRCEHGIDDKEGCQAVLTIEEAEAMLNEHAAFKRGIQQINWRAKTESLDGHLRNVVIEISDTLLTE